MRPRPGRRAQKFNPEPMDSYKKLNPTLNGKPFKPTLVGDSATWIKAYQGGCIVNTIRPVFILNGNSTIRPVRSTASEPTSSAPFPLPDK